MTGVLGVSPNSCRVPKGKAEAVSLWLRQWQFEAEGKVELEVELEV